MNNTVPSEMIPIMKLKLIILYLSIFFDSTSIQYNGWSWRVNINFITKLLIKVINNRTNIDNISGYMIFANNNISIDKTNSV